jgi:hypothetical protein
MMNKSGASNTTNFPVQNQKKAPKKRKDEIINAEFASAFIRH